MLEASGTPVRNQETLEKAWQLWNEGKRTYLVGGSDVHDVWNFESASARTYVHIDGEPTIESFAAALLAGRSYATQGPLVFPEIVFGSELVVANGDELQLDYTVQAVTGLDTVTLIENGQVKTTKARAKAVRSEADRMITLAKEGTLPERS